MTPEERLKAAFAADEPPARDYAFTVGVMQAVARRRLWLNLVLLMAPAIAAAAVLWGVSPQLEPLAESAMQGLQPAFAAVVVTLFLAAAGWRILKPLRA